MAAPLNERQIREMGRPDSVLPPELRHEKIREVREVGVPGQPAYQIVFDQHWMPYGYAAYRSDDWELQYARTEYDNNFSGLLGWLLPNREYLCAVVVSTEEPGFPWGDDA